MGTQIPMLGGLDTATQNLPQLGNLFWQFSHPGQLNWEDQQAFKKKLLTDPNLVEQLSDVERNAPGTLSKLGLGENLSSAISAQPKSTERQQSEDLGALRLKIAKQESDYNTATYNDRVNAIQGESKLRDAEVKRLTNQLSNQEALKGIDINGAINDFVNGKNNPNVTTILGSGQEGADLFNQGVSLVKQQRMIEQQDKRARALESYHAALLNSRDDRLARQQAQVSGREMFMQTKAFTPQDWTNYLSDDNLLTRGQNLISNPNTDPNKLNPADKKLYNMTKLIQMNTDVAMNSRKLATKNSIASSLSALTAMQKRKATVDELSPAVDDINSKFQQLTQLGESPRSAQLDKNGQFHIVDENTGLDMNSDNWNNSVKAPYPRQVIDMAVNEYNNQPDVRAKNNWQLKLRRNNPALYNLVMQRTTDKRGFFQEAGEAANYLTK